MTSLNCHYCWVQEILYKKSTGNKMHEEMMFQNQELFVVSENSGRSLIESTIEKVGSTAATIVPKWKESLWDASSTEPAMLRVPIVVLTFIILFALDVIILDRFKLQYHNVMSIKSGIDAFILLPNHKHTLNAFT